LNKRALTIARALAFIAVIAITVLLQRDQVGELAVYGYQEYSLYHSLLMHCLAPCPGIAVVCYGAFFTQLGRWQLGVGQLWEKQPGIWSVLRSGCGGELISTKLTLDLKQSTDGIPLFAINPFLYGWLIAGERNVLLDSYYFAGVVRRSKCLLCLYFPR
jgi:hypothetical protein